MKVEILIDGIPSKGRPRFHNGRVYTPSKTKMLEEYIGWAYRRASACQKFKGAIAIRIYTYNKPTKASPGRYDTRKPDVDNIAKVVLDALNGVAYTDDKQVVLLTIFKRNDAQKDAPETRIIIQNVYEKELNNEQRKH